MESISEFFHMGGYAAFVWPSFGITALVMIGIAIDSWRSFVQERATLEKLQSQRPGRRNS